MKKEITLHPAQASILRELLYKPEARFSELNITGLTNDHFTFHVQQLVVAELVTKTDDGRYALTPQGKEFANRFDTDTQTVKVEKQAKIGVNICCIKRENDKLYFLLQQRLKQPYFGHWGFITGKIKWGEKVYETAARELEEEAGLKADLTLMSVKHKMDYDQNEQLLEDKFFFRFLGENVQGDLLPEIAGGKNAWVSEEDIKTLSPLFHDMEEVIAGVKDYLKTRSFHFEEKSYIAENF